MLEHSLQLGNLELQWPWVFALLPLPLLLRFFSRSSSSQQDNSTTSGALRVPFFDELRSLSGGGNATQQQRGSLIVMSLLWLSLLLAASRPLWLGEPVPLHTSGRDLMLGVDISGSMGQEDMVIQGEGLPRLTVVKAVVNAFVQQRKGDKLGLILFGSRAYIQSPLSFDTETLNILMSEAQVGFAGKATAIGDAIGFAIKRLRQRPENARVLILLTDGADTASTLPPLQAAEMAARENIKIYTIGMGATEMEVPGLFGSRLGARKINPSADLDEDTLRSIAQQTGGEYYRARDPEELQSAYRAIAALEPIEQEQEMLRPQRSLLHWPLAAAVLFSLIFALQRSGLASTRRHEHA